MSVILENNGYQFGIYRCMYAVRSPEDVIFFTTMRRSEAVAVYLRHAGR